MAATEMQSVVIRGKFRGEKTVIKFRRWGDGWEMRSTVGKNTMPIWCLGRDCKPCWTVATEMLRKEMPLNAKPPTRERLEPRPELKLYA